MEAAVVVGIEGGGEMEMGFGWGCPVRVTVVEGSVSSPLKYYVECRLIRYFSGDENAKALFDSNELYRIRVGVYFI